MIDLNGKIKDLLEELGIEHANKRVSIKTENYIFSISIKRRMYCRDAIILDYKKECEDFERDRSIINNVIRSITEVESAFYDKECKKGCIFKIRSFDTLEIIRRFREEASCLVAISKIRDSASQKTTWEEFVKQNPLSIARGR